MEKKAITNESMDINEVVAFLRKKAGFWKFSRLLQEIYEGEELLPRRLVNKLLEYEETGNYEKISRKVRNWLHDYNLPENREELFKICFALDLDEQRADCILGITAENGIHYRNPKELIYAFCLRKNYDYPYAASLAQRLIGEDLPSGTLEYRLLAKETCMADSRECMTASVRNEFKRIDTVEELEQFLMEYRPCFGIHHNTAYRKFMKLMNYLLFPECGSSDLPVEKSYSVERVVKEYLRMDVPYDKKYGKYSKLQKDIKKHWPTSKTINGMCSRKIDVDRKTLMLLYLATEGMIGEENMDEIGIQEHFRRMNLMLSECGMAKMNLHSPFDYLVMQAMNKENEEDFMSYRMEWMLHRLFGVHNQAAYIYVSDKENK